MDTDHRFRNSLGRLTDGRSRRAGQNRVAPLPLRQVLRGMQAAVDWVLPPRCCLCSTIIEAEDGVSSGCFQTLHFLTEPLCGCCGRPMSGALLSVDALSVMPVEGQAAGTARPQADVDPHRCGACLASPPTYDWMRASFAYNASSRALVLALKYRDRLDVVPSLTRWMALSSAGLIGPGDLVMPVPLHWRRHLARRFNQSAALAQGLAQRTGATFAPDWVVRTRNTAPMKAMSQRERLTNVRDAFRVVERHGSILEGSTVVRVDDVHTSGATINALRIELRNQGVARIGVTVVARVLDVHHLSKISEPI